MDGPPSPLCFGADQMRHSTESSRVFERDRACCVGIQTRGWGRVIQAARKSRKKGGQRRRQRVRAGVGKRRASRTCVRGMSRAAPEQKPNVWLSGDEGVRRRARRPSSGVREPRAKARSTRPSEKNRDGATEMETDMAIRHGAKKKSHGDESERKKKERKSTVIVLSKVLGDGMDKGDDPTIVETRRRLTLGVEEACVMLVAQQPPPLVDVLLVSLAMPRPASDTRAIRVRPFRHGRRTSLAVALYGRSNDFNQPEDATYSAKYLRHLRDQPLEILGFPYYPVTLSLVDALAVQVKSEAGNVMQNIQIWGDGGPLSRTPHLQVECV
ncbi:hypothetical protein BJY52DRAFT_1226536 [Lactarius psammicola]|nr:hypothetical protein BJY52DRAFT_1226536 [Lactarius psammicola]